METAIKLTSPRQGTHPKPVSSRVTMHSHDAMRKGACGSFSASTFSLFRPSELILSAFNCRCYTEAMALNRTKEIQSANTLSDKVAGYITNIAGSMSFLVVNVLWFVTWLLVNTGAFGEHMIVDSFPFSFLTTAVSLEAIILSSFVLMSQRRQAKITELRTELDYKADLQSEIDIKTIVNILERMAKAQGVEIRDLVTEMKAEERRAVRAESVQD